MSRKSSYATKRSYPRVARVNEVLREVIADELERVEQLDDELYMVTVTGVSTDPDLRHATVWFSALTHGVRTSSKSRADRSRVQATGGPEEDVAEALRRHRVRLQAAVARELRLKRTPELQFKPDPAITEGLRIEEIIRSERRRSALVPTHDTSSDAHHSDKE